MWIPAGFAHGFLTLSESADVLYKSSGFWSKSSERSLRWDDPDLAIDWPLDQLEGTSALLADKDAAAPSLAERRLDNTLPQF
jgi:dTDP-4-dehydrorhamnose 3,5-epimerase